MLAALLLPATGLFREPWDKQPERWDLADALKILRDSPWSPSKSQLEVEFSAVRRIDPLTRLPTDSPASTRDTRPEVSIDLGRGKPLPPLTVLWWSAKTIRLAQQRLRRLLDSPVPKSPLEVEALSDFVIVIEGNEALQILRDADKDLRESAYLETPGGMALDPSAVEFHEGEKAGGDYVAFHFPRRLEGEPTITCDTERVVFHCKATAKTTHPGRANFISVRVVFEPKNMRAAGQPDL
jgi:hypothetical protein